MEYVPNGSEHTNFLGSAPGICPKCHEEVMYVRGGRSGIHMKNKCGIKIFDDESYINCPKCGIFYDRLENLMFL